MLASLYIENLAVIEKTSIDFLPGLTVFTGETGAGKSIMIDAINACLGQRTFKEMVRSGERKARVFAVFRSYPEAVRTLLTENGYLSEEGELVISREIDAEGRSSARVNERPCTVSFLKELGGHLINIHGQHDNQILLSADKHLSIVDSFGDLQGKIGEYQKKFDALRETLRQLHNLSKSEEDKKRRVELLEARIAEIEKAKLSPKIDEFLEEKVKLTRNVERIAQSLERVCAALNGTDETQGAVELLSEAKNAMEGLAEFPDFQESAEQLESLHIDLEELSYLMARAFSSLEYNQNEADAMERKLAMINRLKGKYAPTIPEILSICAKAKEELEGIADSEAALQKLNFRARSQKAEVLEAAKLLTEKRREAGQNLARRIEDEARFLEMPNLRMDVAFTPCKLSTHGDHTAELLISANAGEPPKAISKIASGGELSRIMLAIKSALADKDQIDTLIFDEIDTGVSGKAAQKIGLKLRAVAGNRQVLCVTHAAQIAALSDNHLLIQKHALEGRTFTQIKHLDRAGRIEEVARIFSTNQVTDLMRQTAASMIDARDEGVMG